VKGTDAGTEELPDRLISSHRNFVTENGLAAIEASIGRFEAAHRAAVDKGDAQAAAAALREVVRYWRAPRASCAYRRIGSPGMRNLPGLFAPGRERHNNSAQNLSSEPRVDAHENPGRAGQKRR
jgi:hypothetical protein